MSSIVQNVKLPEFKSWQSKSNNTVYQAASDGIVLAYESQSGGAILQILTDSTNPPTVVKGKWWSIDGGTYGQVVSPIKKGDYWKIVSSADFVFWIPLKA